MQGAVRFDGRVALVTGAGSGLGRAHALLLAARGARVVVNDTGGDAQGVGADASRAQRVVDEINAAGGEAVAVLESVEYGERIVAAALDRFGRLDIVVSNAGILRDRTFNKMSDDEWEAVYRVHLYGAYKVTRAAWPHMAAQRYGRVVMTTSGSGLYGNVGQANYAAAKMGVVGLVTALAREGVRYDIRVNAVSPSAASRLTQGQIPQEWTSSLTPQQVSPLVACLCNEGCRANGGIFEAGGGWVGRVRLQRSCGAFFDPAPVHTPEDLMSQWDRIDDFSQGESPASIEEITAPLSSNMARVLADTRR